MVKPRAENSNGALSARQRKKYFDMLNEEEMKGLYEFYRADFDLFEYSMEDYLGQAEGAST